MIIAKIIYIKNINLFKWTTKMIMIIRDLTKETQIILAI